MIEAESIYKETVKVQPWTASSYEELENIRKRASYDLRYAYAVRDLTLAEVAFELCNGHCVQFYKGESRFVALRLNNADAVADKELPANVVVAGEYIIKEFDIEIATTEAYGLAAHEFRRELNQLDISATTDIYYPDPEKTYLGCNGFAATLFGAIVPGESKWLGRESDRFVLSRTAVVDGEGNILGSGYGCVSTLINNPMPTSLTDLVNLAPKENLIHKYRGKNWTVCQSDTMKQVAYKLVGLALLADVYGLGAFSEQQFSSAVVAHEYARIARLNAVMNREEQPKMAEILRTFRIFTQYYFNKNVADGSPFYAAGRISYALYEEKHGKHLRFFRPRGGSVKKKLTISNKAKTMGEKAKSAKCSLRTLYNHGVRSSRQTNIAQILNELSNDGVYVYKGTLQNAKRQAIKRYNKQHPDKQITLIKVG